MDNLPKDPPDQNSNFAPSTGNPPPFGSNFNPHANPVDPNNPYAAQPPNPPARNASASVAGGPTPSVHSEVAEHRPRDAHGHFLPYEHPMDAQPQTPIQSGQTLPARNASPSDAGGPPLVETDPKHDSKDSDPPIFTIRNPITYIKRWWNKILAKEGVDFRLGFKIRPITAVLIASIIISGGISSGVTAFVLKTFFPTSSPVLHRQIIQQGTIQTGTGGFYLTASDSSIWKLKPKKPNVNLKDQVGKQVTVAGNLTSEANLIEVSEIILSNSSQTPPASPTQRGEPNTPTNLPNIPNQDLLPKLYSGLQWDLTQRKILLFTSGKRRIEQEGVYLESSQVTDLPQAFLDYYTQNLQNLGFKETLNSSEPAGTTITYAKDELFLTFGVKNIYSGSGENKKLVGYKAFIEHN